MAEHHRQGVGAQQRHPIDGQGVAIRDGRAVGPLGGIEGGIDALPGHIVGGGSGLGRCSGAAQSWDAEIALEAVVSREKCRSNRENISIVVDRSQKTGRSPREISTTGIDKPEQRIRQRGKTYRHAIPRLLAKPYRWRSESLRALAFQDLSTPLVAIQLMAVGGTRDRSRARPACSSRQRAGRASFAGR